MDKKQRVAAVLAGQRPDRPPVSFWYHFDADSIAGPRAVEAHVRHVETYDLDFLKIMDDNRYPRTATPSGVLESAADLDKLSVLRGDEDSFARQLELIGELARHFADRLFMATTVFNAWTTLRNMTAPEVGHGPPALEPSTDPREAAMGRFLRESPAALERALNVMSESLANFARQCLAAGADGIYLSVHDDWVDAISGTPGTYDRLVRPTDLRILAAVSGAPLNILHICGKAIEFKRFAGYPVQVLHWYDRGSGPSIAEAAGWVKPAICGGLDNLKTMVTGSPQDCAAEVADAVRQAGSRPIIVAPGCTFDPQRVPPENLHAIRQAVEEQE
jgi:uroporphyrinogen decarboxylase